VIFNIFFWQILAATAFLIDSFLLPNNLYITLLFFFALWTQLFIDILSCYVLWDAFKRMQNFSKDNQNLDINVTMIRLHIASYSLFIASLLMYLGSYLIPTYGLISLMTIVISLANTLSQAILGFIFLYICNSHKEPPAKPKKINYSKDSIENLSKQDESSSEEEYPVHERISA